MVVLIIFPVIHDSKAFSYFFDNANDKLFDTDCRKPMTIIWQWQWC